MTNPVEGGQILLVNDGSPRAEVEQALKNYLDQYGVEIIHHERNRGVAAARNTAVKWAREKRISLLIMVDSDCVVGSDFVEQHLRLHREYPEAAAFGGGVVGTGHSLWAKLDKIVSWVHSVPFGRVRRVETPYHLPTTNFSIKISSLPPGDKVFDERLNTGEDALLIRGLRQAGKSVWFSPEPTIQHADRETLSQLLRHQYVWGYHQYFVQLTGDMSPIGFNPLFRACFLTVFIPCIPLFAALGSGLNLLPWLRHKPMYLLALPAVYVIWLAKSIAVAEAALRPAQCLRLTAAEPG